MARLINIPDAPPPAPGSPQGFALAATVPQADLLAVPHADLLAVPQADLSAVPLADLLAVPQADLSAVPLADLLAANRLCCRTARSCTTSIRTVR